MQQDTKRMERNGMERNGIGWGDNGFLCDNRSNNLKSYNNMSQLNDNHCKHLIT